MGVVAATSAALVPPMNPRREIRLVRLGLLMRSSDGFYSVTKSRRQDRELFLRGNSLKDGRFEWSVKYMTVNEFKHGARHKIFNASGIVSRYVHGKGRGQRLRQRPVELRL